MAPRRLLIALGIVSLLVFLAALLPARVALKLAGLPAGSVAGVAGTLWSGSARRVTAGNRSFGPVAWNLKPWRFVAGQLAARVKARLPDGFANGGVAVRPGGALDLDTFEAVAPLPWLLPGTVGQVSARFDKLELEKGRITAAVGTLNVGGVQLPVPTGGKPLPPGNYAVTFAADDVPEGKPLTGELKDAGGPLEIAGTVTFTPPASYEVTGKAKPRPDAPAELRSALQMLGPVEPDGSHALSLAGSF